MNIESIITGNPYKKYKEKSFVSDVLSWPREFDDIVFKNIINRAKPNTIIELGSFLGYSTFKMLDECKLLNLSTQCICIDTWLGGADHLINYKRDTDRTFFKYYNLDCGISGVFDQFCINVVNKSYDSNIIPLPNTTDNAFIYLSKFNIKSDLIYVDASHTEEQTYKDIKNYYSLLNTDGIMFGHDINWSGVKNAVEQFCIENNLTYKTYYDKYWEITDTSKAI
jgi:hypothetical protein